MTSYFYPPEYYANPMDILSRLSELSGGNQDQISKYNSSINNVRQGMDRS
jgi:hypothetical protein